MTYQETRFSYLLGMIEPPRPVIDVKILFMLNIISWRPRILLSGMTGFVGCHHNWRGRLRRCVNNDGT